MKLIFCESCHDLFNLSLAMKKCSCGKTYGRYVDERNAEVSRDAVSIGIGNGSLQYAIRALRERNNFEKISREGAQTIGKIEYAWVRANNGISNPHTKIITD